MKGKNIFKNLFIALLIGAIVFALGYYGIEEGASTILLRQIGISIVALGFITLIIRDTIKQVICSRE